MEPPETTEMFEKNFQETEAQINTHFQGKHYHWSVDTDDYNEFSWQKCDTCGQLAGPRYLATAVCINHDRDDWPEFSVCPDCVGYMAYAELPVF